MILFWATQVTGSETAATPQRWISLAPHLTELVFEAGAGERLVGAVEWSDHPDAARSLPRIGDAWRLDVERMLRLDADLVLAWGGTTPPAAIERIEALGIRVEILFIESLDDIAPAIIRLGELHGAPEIALRTARSFEQELSVWRDKASNRGDPVRVFYQVSSRPLFTLGGEHPINEIFEACGAANLFGETGASALNVDPEAVLRRDPDAILIGADAEPPIEPDPASPLDRLRATECGHVLSIDASLLVRPTPRVLQGIERLCDWLEREVRNADPAECRPRSAAR